MNGDGFASAIVDELEVDLEHEYRIAQRAENATIFFAIVQSIFVDVFLNERFILQVGTALA